MTHGGLNELSYKAGESRRRSSTGLGIERRQHTRKRLAVGLRLSHRRQIEHANIVASGEGARKGGEATMTLRRVQDVAHTAVDDDIKREVRRETVQRASRSE